MAKKEGNKIFSKFCFASETWIEFVLCFMCRESYGECFEGVIFKIRDGEF